MTDGQFVGARGELRYEVHEPKFYFHSSLWFLAARKRF